MNLDERRKLTSNLGCQEPRKSSDKEDLNGDDQVGRWSKEEHEKFLEAYRLYGKEWKKVQTYIGTRSTTQVRSHAQKYLAKLGKTQVIPPCDSLCYSELKTQPPSTNSSPVSKPSMTDSIPSQINVQQDFQTIGKHCLINPTDDIYRRYPKHEYERNEKIGVQQSLLVSNKEIIRIQKEEETEANIYIKKNLTQDYTEKSMIRTSKQLNYTSNKNVVLETTNPEIRNLVISTTYSEEMKAEPKPRVKEGTFDIFGDIMKFFLEKN